MSETVDLVVIGAGQAGLSLSYELSHAGVEHVVLERGRVGESWRGRWDSFCLVTPNWTMQLPGGNYQGHDPHGFMPKDQIVRHFVRYANAFNAPVREGVEVFAVDPAGRNRFVVRTSRGEICARRVVVASGGFQKPHRPPYTGCFPTSTRVFDGADYTNAASLPRGDVLIIGSGQTGCQLAEELSDSGRGVFLSCGRNPWLPRRLGDRDFVDWLTKTAFLEATVRDLPNPLARLGGNVQSTGCRGGHDLHYRTLHAQGVMLLGRFAGFEDGIAYFTHDLEESVAFGDARYADVCGLIRKTCVEKGMDVPDMPPPAPFTSSARTSLDVRRFGAVIFTSGYRPDYANWIPSRVGSTNSVTQSSETARAQSCPASTSWACTFSANASRRAFSASQRMPPSSPSASGSNAELPLRRVSCKASEKAASRQTRTRDASDRMGGIWRPCWGATWEGFATPLDNLLNKRYSPLVLPIS